MLEKERTTPEGYPLSTNALILACNQKTSRLPVTDYSLREVEDALQGLRDRGLVRTVQGTTERVAKHQHRLEDAFDLNAQDFAVLAVLLLRGPQTAGELRSRTERYTSFPDVSAVDASLRRLAAHKPSLARDEGRAPGQSQTRYVQTLGADPEKQRPRARPAAVSVNTENGETPTLQGLQREIDQLRAQVERLLEYTGLDMDVDTNIETDSETDSEADD